MAWCISVTFVLFFQFKARCGKIQETHGLDIAMQVGGISLTFMLSQKTHLAYARWWEGRGHIGAAALAVRNLGSKIVDVYSKIGKQKPQEQTQLFREILVLLRLWIPILRQHIKLEISSGWKMETVQDWNPGVMGTMVVTLPGLSSNEQAEIERSLPNPLIVVHHKLGSKIRTLVGSCCKDDFTAQSLLRSCEDDLTTLLSAYHGADKIAKTPMPAVYDLLLSAAIGTYMFALFPYYLPVSSALYFGLFPHGLPLRVFWHLIFHHIQHAPSPPLPPTQPSIKANPTLPHHNSLTTPLPRPSVFLLGFREKRVVHRCNDLYYT
jgi:predicted membrane chloride channel (bestrophin family)